MNGMNRISEQCREYDLAGRVIGLAMRVHPVLGPGFAEAVHEKAPEIELMRSGIRFERQKVIQVFHEVQLVNYLAAIKIDDGLLINFGGTSPEFKRKYRNPRIQNSVNSVNSVKGFSCRSAFTMLELLVAMTLMAILLALLLNMVDGATKLWRVNENRVDSYREARAALGVMTRDLQNALTAPSNGGQFLLNAAVMTNLPASAVKNSNSAVFFLAALPLKAQEASNKSDVCQVGYYLAFDRTAASTNKSLNLYRYFTGSDATFTNLIANTPFQNPRPTIGPAGDELLARNITGFRIAAWSLSANNTLGNFTASVATPLPDIVEIEISAINQDAAKKLDNTLSAWTSTNSALFSNVISPVMQTFTTRIKLNRPQ